jgi:hypothetical protein
MTNQEFNSLLNDVSFRNASGYSLNRSKSSSTDFTHRPSSVTAELSNDALEEMPPLLQKHLFERNGIKKLSSTIHEQLQYMKTMAFLLPDHWPCHACFCFHRLEKTSDDSILVPKKDPPCVEALKYEPPNYLHWAPSWGVTILRRLFGSGWTRHNLMLEHDKLGLAHGNCFDFRNKYYRRQYFDTSMGFPLHWITLYDIMARAQRDLRYHGLSKSHRLFSIKQSRVSPESSTSWRVNIKLLGLSDRLLLKEESEMSLINDPTSSLTRIPSCTHFFDFPDVVNQCIRGVLDQSSIESRSCGVGLICYWCHIETYFYAIMGASDTPPIIRVLRYADLGPMTHPLENRWTTITDIDRHMGDANKSFTVEDGPTKSLFDQTLQLQGLDPALRRVYLSYGRRILGHHV